MRSDEWISLLNGTGDPDSASSLVKGAAEELDQRVEADPEIEARIASILDRAFGRRIDYTTLTTTQSALAVYLGDDVAYLLVWLSEPNAMVDRLDDFAAIASEQAANLVRSLVGRYWQELRDAQDLAGQSADEWKNLTQEAFLDQITNKYVLRVRIEKYSGDNVVLELSPNSALALVKFVTRSLLTIATPELFDPTTLNDYLSDVEDLRSRTAEGDAEPLDSAVAEIGDPSSRPNIDMPEVVH